MLFISDYDTLHIFTYMHTYFFSNSNSSLNHAALLFPARICSLLTPFPAHKLLVSLVVLREPDLQGFEIFPDNGGVHLPAAR